MSPTVWEGAGRPDHRTPKYRNERCACDLGGVAHMHDSRKERMRCWTLHQKAAAGLITNLRRQPRWHLEVNGVPIGAYTADFSYETAGGLVVEDVKAASPAARSRDYPLRKALMLACHGIQIQEV